MKENPSNLSQQTNPDALVSHEGLGVLCINSDLQALREIKAMLEPHGFIVHEAQTGAAAMKKMQAESYECIVVDAAFPMMSGFDLVRSIRRTSDIPVVMINKKRDRKDVEKALEVGVTEYVIRPLDASVFVTKVRSCVNRSIEEKEQHRISLFNVNDASISLPLSLASINEYGVSALMAFPYQSAPESGAVQFQCPLFRELSLEHVALQWFRTEPMQSGGYKVDFRFVGATEADLRRIRQFMQREEVRRRK